VEGACVRYYRGIGVFRVGTACGKCGVGRDSGVKGRGGQGGGGKVRWREWMKWGRKNSWGKQWILAQEKESVESKNRDKQIVVIKLKILSKKWEKLRKNKN
jgi:hypothetical protein